MNFFRHKGSCLPVPQGLVNAGPLVGVELSAHPRVDNVSPILGVKLMVDTGAQKTVIHDEIAVKLGLVPLRFESIVGVSGKPEDCPVYRMQMRLKMANHVGVEAQIDFATDVVGAPLLKQGFDCVGLIGRDFLKHVKLVYDGPNGCFEIRSEIAGADNSHSRPSEASRADKKAARKAQKAARRKNR